MGNRFSGHQLSELLPKVSSMQQKIMEMDKERLSLHSAGKFAEHDAKVSELGRLKLEFDELQQAIKEKQETGQ